MPTSNAVRVVATAVAAAMASATGLLPAWCRKAPARPSYATPCRVQCRGQQQETNGEQGQRRVGAPGRRVPAP